MAKVYNRKRNGNYKQATKTCKELAGYTCSECGTDYSQHSNKGMMIEADHIIPIKDGGARMKQSNLIALCGRYSVNKCHQKRHYMTDGSFKGWFNADLTVKTEIANKYTK